MAEKLRVRGRLLLRSLLVDTIIINRGILYPPHCKLNKVP